MRRCKKWCADALQAWRQARRDSVYECSRRNGSIEAVAMSCKAVVEAMESRVFLSVTPMRADSAIVFRDQLPNLANSIADAALNAVGAAHGEQNHISDAVTFALTPRAVRMQSAIKSVPTVAKAAKSSALGKTGTAVTLAVLGADPAGESTLTYTWSATGPAAVTFSGGNKSNAAKSTSATVIAAGRYDFTVTIADRLGRTVTSITRYTVTHKESGISVVPSHALVGEGKTRQFTAVALDQFQHRLATQPTIKWSIRAGGAGGTINSRSGLYTAPASKTGTDNVIAADATESKRAVVTVVANAVGSATGSLNGSLATAASAYNLSEIGTADWIHWGRGGVYGNVDRSATGGSQISDVSVLGSGDVGAFTATTRFVTWTHGSPTANEPADDGYIFDSNALGAGFSFTVPADKTTRTLSIDAGGLASGAQLTAHLSDGSAADYVVSASGTGQYTNLYTINYNSASDGQTLTITYVKNQNIGGSSGSVDLIAAMVAGGSGAQTRVVPLTIMPLGDSVTAGVGLDGDTSSSPNYRLPLYTDLNAAGIAVQFEGANDPTNVDSSRPGYCPELYDLGQNFNNGFEGYTSGDILANLAGNQAPEFFPVIPNQGGYWLTGGGTTGRPAEFPNVALLMVGTNDAIFGVPLGSPTTAGTLEGNVTAILKWFATNRPATTVVIGTAIPNADATKNSEIVAYDSWLTTQLPTTSNVRVVNMYPIFTNSDGSTNTNMLQADGVHPSEAGYADIGAAWANAIEEI